MWHACAMLFTGDNSPDTRHYWRTGVFILAFNIALLINSVTVNCVIYKYADIGVYDGER